MTSMKNMDLCNIIRFIALFISLITFVADVLSDYILVIQYGLFGFLDYCLLTLTFAFMPSIITMVFSLHWYNCDDKLNRQNFCIHVLQLGLLYRYIQLIISGWKASKPEKECSEEEYNQKQNDVCLLRIFEAFLEAAPQLVLQLYIMMSNYEYSIWTSITAISSVMSLGWAIVAYTKAQRCSRLDKKQLSLFGTVLQTVWRIFLIAARILSLSLAATVLSYWLILFLAVHFVCMLCWVVYQKTDFSKLIWEEYLFNFVMACVYCFCFFNLQETRSRWRMIAFYTVILCENCGLLVLYFFYSQHELWQVIAGVILVLIMTIVGLSCMILYYSCFHPVGRIRFTIKGPEAGSVSQPEVNLDIGPIRKMKKSRSICLVPRRPQSDSFNKTKQSVRSSSSDPGCMSSPGSPISQPLVSAFKKRETLCSIQDLLENMSSLEDLKDDPVVSSCLKPTEDDSDIDGRGFCLSQNEVGIPLIKTICLSEPNLADGSSDTKISDITDTDSNVTVIPADPGCLHEFHENDSNSECHDDYENLYDATTQEIDAPPPLTKRRPPVRLSETQSSHVSSTHDYENVAPINIHRDIMGIRHWKPYFDIGDRIHDYSTFKDKSKLTELTGFSTSNLSSLRERDATPLTMSMPDLTLPDEDNRPVESPKLVVPYMQTNPMMRFASLDDLSNYETIWVESCEDVKRSSIDHSSLVATINNVRAKESLNNLYYSRLSELSRQNLKRGNSDIARKTEVELSINNMPAEETPSKKMFIMRTPKSAGNRCKRTFSILLEKLEASQWASLRTPVRRQISIHHKTAKALQAGIRVFHRPKVHTITPKRESKEALNWDQNIRIKRSPNLYATMGQAINIPMSATSSTGQAIQKPMVTTNSMGHKFVDQLREGMSSQIDAGPRHSTPETNRHAPQISVLSGLSSVVASPEDSYDSRLSNRKDELSTRRPLEENKNLLNYQLPSIYNQSDKLINKFNPTVNKNSDINNLNTFNSENFNERQIM